MKIWKDVKDFPNYQVSNLGNVRNKKTNKLLKWMDVLKNEGRYICYEVILYNDTRKVGFHKKIHRLVAEAFIANPDNKCDVDHIDGNTDNNNMTNLRWATRAENRLNTNNKPKYTNPTGEINISMNNDKFVVRVNRKNIGTYATLEEAQDARYQYINKLLNASIKKVSEYGKYITKREERTLPYIFQIMIVNRHLFGNTINFKYYYQITSIEEIEMIINKENKTYEEQLFEEYINSKYEVKIEEQECLI